VLVDVFIVLWQSLILDDLSSVRTVKFNVVGYIKLGDGCFIDLIKDRISCNSNKYIKGNNFSSKSLDL